MAGEDFRSRIIISAKSSAEKVFASTARASGKVVKSLGKVAAAGAAAGAATSAAFAVSSVKKAGNFQTAIADLSAITGATGKDLAFLSAQAKAFGQASQGGAAGAAEAFKLVASAKPDLLENSAALAETTRNVLLLSEATGNTLAASADTVGSALNQFGAEADQASRFINVLAAGSKFGSSEVADTAEALKKAGVAAASAGINFETTNAAIQTLAGVGIKGAEAGTALRGVFLKLQTQAKDEFNPAIVGVQAALQNLSDANLTATEKTKLFGQENFVAATALIENRDKLHGLTEALTGTAVANEQAAKKQATFEAQSKLLANAFEVLQINVGEKFLPVLTDVVKITTQIIKEFSTEAEKVDELDAGFSTLDATIRTIVGTMTGLKTIVEVIGKTMGATVAAFVSIVSGDFDQVDDILSAAFNDITTTVDEGFTSAVETMSRKTPEAVKSALTTPIVVEAAHEAGKVIGGAMAEGVAVATEEQSQLAQEAQLADLARRVENIRVATLTEVEAENERQAAIRETLIAAKEQKLIDDAEFRELEARAVAEHEGRLIKIRKNAAKADLFFARNAAIQKTKSVLQQMQQMTAGVASENKVLFRINQAAALGNAVINTAQAITSALAVQPFPVGLALAAVAAAAGAAQISAIASAKPGGGTTPSLAGTAGSVGGQVVPANAPADVGVASFNGDDPGLAEGRQTNILIQGIPEAGVMPAETVRELIGSINEELGDGANLNVSGGSGGGV